MSLSYLSVIKKMFGGKDLAEDERLDLVKEVMVMTLARVTRTDTNIESEEVATVRRVLKEKLGEDLSPADVRVAASSELFEKEPLERHLKKAGILLSDEDKEMVARALGEVIHADTNVHERETEFFDKAVKALGVSDAVIADIRDSF